MLEITRYILAHWGVAGLIIMLVLSALIINFLYSASGGRKILFALVLSGLSLHSVSTVHASECERVAYLVSMGQCLVVDARIVNVYTHITEDSRGWNCATMGNRICGQVQHPFPERE